MLSPFLFSAAGGLAVYWSPPASEEGGQPSAPVAHDRREECFFWRTSRWFKVIHCETCAYNLKRLSSCTYFIISLASKHQTITCRERTACFQFMQLLLRRNLKFDVVWENFVIILYQSFGKQIVCILHIFRE